MFMLVIFGYDWEISWKPISLLSVQCPISRKSFLPIKLLVVKPVAMISQQPKIKRVVILLMHEPWYFFVLVVLIAIGIAVGLPLTRVALRTMNNARMARFADRIASADQIDACALSSPVPVLVSVTGLEARRVIGAVSSANRDTASYPNIWEVKVRFLKGTNVLAEIKSSGDLFLVNGKQYRDSTGALRELAVMPAYDAFSREREKQRMFR